MKDALHRASRNAVPDDALQTQPFLAFTASGPILVMAKPGAGAEGHLRRGLRRRGHAKFIAWRVSEAELRQAYGLAFETIAANLSDEQPLRVLDYDGARVFDTVSVRRLDMPVVSEG